MMDSESSLSLSDGRYLLIFIFVLGSVFHSCQPPPPTSHSSDLYPASAVEQEDTNSTQQSQIRSDNDH